MNEVPTHRYVWNEGNTGRRPDQVLAHAWGVSRVAVQRWMDEGLVQCNGQALGPRAKPDTGAEILVTPPAPVPDTVTPEDIPLTVLHEDDDVIVINKPPGLAVHPGAGCREGTLVAALLHHCGGTLSGIGGVERPGIVHRLDKDTSGVLIAAKNDAAHRALASQFHDRMTQKIYLAWVCPPPRPTLGTWNGAIGRHAQQRHKMTVVRDPSGRTARTDYRVRETRGRAALLELRLHTGRTHQIRVHTAHAGCPVAGDKVYGKQAAAMAPRQMLHAWKLTFTHPATGKTIEITADPPEDFQNFAAASLT